MEKCNRKKKINRPFSSTSKFPLNDSFIFLLLFQLYNWYVTRWKFFTYNRIRIYIYIYERG